MRNHTTDKIDQNSIFRRKNHTIYVNQRRSEQCELRRLLQSAKTGRPLNQTTMSFHGKNRGIRRRWREEIDDLVSPLKRWRRWFVQWRQMHFFVDDQSFPLMHDWRRVGAVLSFFFLLYCPLIIATNAHFLFFLIFVQRVSWQSY